MYQIEKGTTSKRLAIFIQDSSLTTGVGLSGLVFNSPGLTWNYWREDAGNVAATAVTLVTATRGTFASGGFVEKDATGMKGCYEIGIPDAALAAGANWVIMMLFGATNMAPLTLAIQLTGDDVGKVGDFKKNVALNNYMFQMTDSTTHAPKTGATVSATRSIDGAAFAACANAVTEVSSGWYKINLAASDLNGDVIALRFTATAADDLNITHYTI